MTQTQVDAPEMWISSPSSEPGTTRKSTVKSSKPGRATGTVCTRLLTTQQRGHEGCCYLEAGSMCEVTEPIARLVIAFGEEAHRGGGARSGLGHRIRPCASAPLSAHQSTQQMHHTMTPVLPQNETDPDGHSYHHNTQETHTSPHAVAVFHCLGPELGRN